MFSGWIDTRRVIAAGFAVFTALLLAAALVVAPARAGDVTFNRAYTGSLSGNTFGGGPLLTADAGSIHFTDNNGARNFGSTTGTLYWKVGGVQQSIAGTLSSRLPNGNVPIDAVVLEAGTTDYLLVLSGTYAANTSYGGSSNSVLSRVNEYVDLNAPDGSTTTITIDGGSSASISVGGTATVTVTVKLTSGTGVSGALVSLNAGSAGKATVSPATATTDGSGVASFTLTGVAAGTSTYTATATANGVTDTTASSVSLTVNAASITLSPAAGALTAGTQGTAYSQTFTASGGTSPYTYAISAGALPTGLSLSSGGPLTGTPTVSGAFSFTVRATDNNSQTGTAAYTLSIATNLAMTTTTLPTPAVGVAYNQSVVTTGGTAPVTFAVSGGALPAGLSLNTSTGAITGTPTTAGAYSFTITATDASSATAAQTFSGTTTAAPSITTTSLPDPAQGVAYNQTIATSGGTAPIGFAVTSGALPAGLSLNASTGAITGTPTGSGAYSFTITITDANGKTAVQAYSGAVTAGLAITTTTLPTPLIGAAYNQTVATTGGTAPITFAVSAGSLPTGLSLTALTGAITGTPTAAGAYSFTIRATDANTLTATQAYSGTIAAALAITTATISNPVIGVGYSQTIATSGGTAPIGFAVTSGALPAGLSLNASTGAITGTPTAAGAYSFTVTATDANSVTDAKAYSGTIAAALAITTATISNPVIGVGYSQTIATSGGTAPIGFAVTSGSLPTGLSLNASTGAITGTPTAAGAYSFTVTVTDANSLSDAETYSGTIAAALAITTASLPTPVLSTAYSQTIATSGGTAPIGFSVTSGSLPAGLSLNASTGAITGTPTASGAYSFTVTATDANSLTDAETYSGAIAAALDITTASLPTPVLSTAYSQTIATSGGTGPVTFAVTSGSLPSGLSLNASTGAITGTPTASGAYSFTVTATDANSVTDSQAYSGTIAAGVSITTASLPTPAVGVAYSQTIATTGGTAPIGFAVTVGSLPTGLSLNASTGAITGTPTASGAYSFEITATDANSLTDAETYSGTISPAIAITTLTLPTPVIGVAYSQAVATSGGTAPIGFTVSAGSLPAGLSLNASSGAITGTATTAGAYSFTILATDANSVSASKTYSGTIGAALAITTASLPTPAVGVAYSQTVATSGGTAPIGFAVSAGSLPAGLSLNASSGAITGTPTTAGAYSFTITATDANSVTDTETYSGTIGAAVAITTISLPTPVLSVAYSQTIATSGGAAPIGFAVISGALPTGLSLNASTGEISGTPTASGAYSFTIEATDDNGVTDSQAYSGTIAAGVSITTLTVATPAVGVSYSQTISTSGGTAPIGFAVTSGSLPAGLSLNASTGAITGTPTAAGAYSFQITATDANSLTGSRTYSGTIAAAVAITTTSLPTPVLSTAYSQTIATSGGTAPIGFAVTSGSLPAGLSLNASTGAITGTPTASGAYSFTVTATDANSVTDAKTYSGTIAAGVSITTASLPTPAVGVAYSQTIATSGGTAPVSFAVTVGSLPTGLSLNASTGAISGTPTASGAYSFEITATDANSLTDAETYSGTISPAIAITTLTLPTPVIGVAYSQAVATSGGTAPVSFSVGAGSLPAGLSLNASSGAITGTATTAGAYSFTILATDANSVSASKTYSGTIGAALAITTATLPTPAVGVAYSQTVATSGGTAPIGFAVSSGSLPAGLSLNASSGAITGTPTTAGAYSFTIIATDANSTTASQAYSGTIGAALSITTATLPTPVLTNAYSQTIATSGGAAPIGFAVISGALPTGLSLNASTGAITGTPTASGAYSFTIEATDDNGVTDSQAYSGTIASAVTITTASLPTPVLTTAYSQTLATSGGTAPIGFAVTSGSLPAGLSLDASTGAISGTPTASGAYSFTVTATDANSLTGSRTYSGTIAAAVAITTTSLPTPVLSNSYSQAISTSGGTAPIGFAVTSGSLPAGLSLNASTGVVSGTPTAAGAYSFTVTATDANSKTAAQAYSGTIAAGVAITTASLPTPVLTVAYSQTLATSGGTAPIAFAVTSGSLPSGLSLNTATGVISGTPTASGAYSFTIEATDANGLSDSKSFSGTIAAAVAITTTTLPTPVLGVAYSQTVATSGGAAPIGFAVSGGSLPAGLSLNAATGAISGTPTASGAYSFTVTATDANSLTASKTYSGSIGAGIAITTASLPTPVIAVAYSQTVATSGGTAPVTFAISSGSLPAGLSLNAATGEISGTPTTAGAYSFTVEATDANSLSASQAYSGSIGAGLAITTASLPTPVISIAYSQTVVTSGGTAPIGFAVSVGSLPTGLSLNASTGVISGTPTAAGAYAFTIEATDANSTTATQAYSGTIGAALSITTLTLPTPVISVAYSQTVATSGGAAPVGFAVSAGALPAGLSLDTSTGAITGTPTAAGAYSFTIKATDANTTTATRTYSGTIIAALSITTATLPTPLVSVAYSQTVATTGGTAPVTFAVSAGALPAGLSLTASTGEISGTATTAGAYSFTVTATDANSVTASQAYSGTIGAGLAITTASLPTPLISVAYSQTIATSGGTAPIGFSVTSGSLPTGLSLNASTGAISGTATASGAYSFTVTATDANSVTAAQAYTGTIAAGVSITTLTLPTPLVGVAYSQTVATSGGTAPVGFTVSAGALPAGLSLNASTGAVSGTPTTAGAYSFTVTATDANSVTASRTYSGTIGAGLAITTATLPTPLIAVAYSQTIATSGGTAPIAFSVSSGVLPAGLSLNASTGAISGTATTAGAYSFTVTATDANSVTASQAYSGSIGAGLAITTASLPTPLVSVAYSQTIATSGGTAPVTFAVTSGSLPTGLSLTASTGAISGTATASGAYAFTITATDANSTTAAQAYSGTIAAGVSITTLTLPTPIIGVAHSQTVATLGGTAPITFAVTAGSLPPGLALNPATGVINGTATAAGAYSFTIRATDANNVTASRTYTGTIGAAVAITTATLPTPLIGVAYSQTIATSGGTAPIGFTLSSGSLPTGLSLNASSGAISGTATTAGAYSFTVTATDANSVTASQAYSGTIGAGLAITTASLPTPLVSVAYSQTIATSGGTAPIGFSVTSGSLPTGLSLNASTGAISGTATASGAYSFEITATDANSVTAAQAYSGTIAAGVSITTLTLPTPLAGVAYSQTIATSGGTAPIGFAVTSGSLPAGLSLDGSTGAITGTATAAGAYSFTVTATDANSVTASRTYSGTIGAGIAITTATLPTPLIGVAFSQTIATSGGTAPVGFTVSAGSLPAGLSLNASTGAITGTATTAGAYSFTVTATDANNVTAAQAYAGTIGSGLAITTATLPTPLAGVAYSQTIATSGGTAPVTFAVTSGSLPTGLSLNVSSGAITGTASASGAYAFTITATDANSTTAAQAYSGTIAAGVSITTLTLPTPLIGVVYSQTVATAGGVAPVAFAVTAGALPAGLTLDASTSAIAGTATTAGAYSFTVTATDANGVTASRTYTGTIGAGLAITTATLPTPLIAIAYSQTIATSGGTAPVAFTVTSGALPAGLSLNAATGAITGTATTAGAYAFTVTATDANSVTASQAYAGAIGAGLAITSPTLQVPLVGVPYSQSVTTSGGTAPVTFAVTAGTLPAGLAIDPATGAITGTPTAEGPYAFTVTVTDANGVTASQAYAGTIGAGIAITTTTLPIPLVGVAYSQTVAVTGGVTPIAFSVSAGVLPAGLALDPATGTITGVPTTAGPYSFTIRAADANGVAATRTFSGTIGPALAITTATLPTPVFAVAYSQTVATSGGTGPVTFAVSTGALPAGLALNAATGAISGAPTAAGPYAFTITATDGSAVTASKAYAGAIGAGIAITTPTLPTPLVGVVYAQTVASSGGTAPATFAVSAGALPAGLTLDAATGAISGTPTAAGAYAFTVTVTDANGVKASQAYAGTIGAGLAIVTASLPDPVVGTPYTQAVSVSGGASPVTFAVVGALPAGLTLDATTGVVSGVPTSPGPYSFSITVTDANGVTATKAFSGTVVAPVSLQVQVPFNTATDINLTSAQAGAVFAIVAAPAHGTLTLNGAVARYTPSANYIGSDRFTFTASVGAAAGVSEVLLTVLPPPPPTAESPPDRTVNGDSEEGGSPGSGNAGNGTSTTTVETATIDLTSLVRGLVTTVRIETPPQHGTVTLEVNGEVVQTVSGSATQAGAGSARSAAAGVDRAASEAAVLDRGAAGEAAPEGFRAIYTPDKGFLGKDYFTFVAVGPGGVSAPATVNIEVIPRPPATKPIVVTAVPGQVVRVPLKGENTGLTGANIVSKPPLTEGQTTLEASGPADDRDYTIVFAPNPAFTGISTITFTLSNVNGTSSPTPITITVVARPDPSTDADTRGLASAETETARRFAGAQLDNFRSRLEAVRAGRAGLGGVSLYSNLGSIEPVTPDQLRERQQSLTGTVAPPPTLAAQQQAFDAQARAEAKGQALAQEPGAKPPVTIEERWRVQPWVAGAISIGRRDPRTGEAKFKVASSGLSAGVDLPLGDKVTLGLGGGVGHDATEIGTSGSRVTADSWVLAAYGSVRPTGGTFVDGVLGAGELAYDLRRFVTPIGDYALGERRGRLLFGSLAAGFDRTAGPLRWTSYGRAEGVRADLDAFDESGGSYYALAYEKRRIDSLVGVLGGSIAFDHSWRGGVLTPNARIEVQHDFLQADDQIVRYQDWLVDDGYRLASDAWARTRVSLSAGASLSLEKSWNLDASLGGEFGEGQALGTARLKVSKSF